LTSSIDALLGESASLLTPRSIANVLGEHTKTFAHYRSTAPTLAANETAVRTCLENVMQSNVTVLEVCKVARVCGAHTQITLGGVGADDLDHFNHTLQRIEAGCAVRALIGVALLDYSPSTCQSNGAVGGAQQSVFCMKVKKATIVG
jgi:hypothetical protein